MVRQHTEPIAKKSAVAYATERYQAQWPGEYILLFEQDKELAPAFHGKYLDEVFAWLEEWFSGVVGPSVVVVPPKSA